MSDRRQHVVSVAPLLRPQILKAHNTKTTLKCLFLQLPKFQKVLKKLLIPKSRKQIKCECNKWISDLLNCFRF
ncbi:hypothetical protein B9Z55_016086 [Caenorhabditis nigoni]|uniref:Uncharacterized protein n=1 Tax=Caenorhabditis nigoni TaxID=1611254 RepID=A0A2G5UDN7_9PELO|nr:hypothetical protein B9Z55_016086 [Caenorhabditis nigoni]